jgi:hypothetical protein
MIFGDVAKELADLWRNMSAEDRKPYEMKAARDKKRYQTEKEGTLTPTLLHIHYCYCMTFINQSINDENSI